MCTANTTDRCKDPTSHYYLLECNGLKSTHLRELRKSYFIVIHKQVPNKETTSIDDLRVINRSHNSIQLSTLHDVQLSLPEISEISHYNYTDPPY